MFRRSTVDIHIICFTSVRNSISSVVGNFVQHHWVSDRCKSLFLFDLMFPAAGVGMLLVSHPTVSINVLQFPTVIATNGTLLAFPFIAFIGLLLIYVASVSTFTSIPLTLLL